MTTEYCPVIDLRPHMTNVNVKCIVLDSTLIATKLGSVYYLHVADSTASVVLTIWGDVAKHMVPGDILSIISGDCRLYKNSLILNLNLAHGPTRLRRTGNFTMVFASHPNLTHSSWIADPKNPHLLIPEHVLSSDSWVRLLHCIVTVSSPKELVLKTSRPRELKALMSVDQFQRPKQYAIDVASAIAAAGFVAPFISIVDKSIVAHASGRQHLKDGLKTGIIGLFRNPRAFYAQGFVFYVWGVYAGTYIAANVIETTCNNLGRSWQYPKFIGTSAANIFLGIWKDKEFAKMFGTKAPTGLSLSSYSLFVARDALTIGASFNVPAILSQKLQAEYSFSKRSADVSSQLLTPCLVQFISTPLHLTALDFYNRPHSTFTERATFLRNEYLKSVGARICRIFPAFGIGGLGNKYLREKGDVLFIRS